MVKEEIRRMETVFHFFKNYAWLDLERNSFSDNLEILLKITKFRQKKKFYLFQQYLGMGMGMIVIVEKMELTAGIALYTNCS